MFKTFSTSEKITLSSFGLGLLLITCCTLSLVAYLVIKPLVNKPAQPDQTALPAETATSLAGPAPAATASPTLPPPALSPTPEPPPAPSPTPEPPDTAAADDPVAEPESETTEPAAESYQLLIVTNGEDSLFVVNQSAGAFPLALFRLENKQGAVDGLDWGLDRLESGACVTIWKESGKPEPPPVTCTEVGQRLTRAKREIFWKKEFQVYYQQQLIDTCAKKSGECLVSIP